MAALPELIQGVTIWTHRLCVIGLTLHRLEGVRWPARHLKRDFGPRIRGIVAGSALLSNIGVFIESAFRVHLLPGTCCFRWTAKQVTELIICFKHNLRLSTFVVRSFRRVFHS